MAMLSVLAPFRAQDGDSRFKPAARLALLALDESFDRRLTTLAGTSDSIFAAVF